MRRERLELGRREMVWPVMIWPITGWADHWLGRSLAANLTVGDGQVNESRGAAISEERLSKNSDSTYRPGRFEARRIGAQSS